MFAVDLTDLGNAEALSRDEVSELLFSASIVGQRRSAARAMANLQKQRLELARTRQGDARANRLLADLEAVRHSLAEAARAAFDNGACVLFGHCEEDLATPYQLFAEALGRR